LSKNHTATYLLGYSTERHLAGNIERWTFWKSFPLLALQQGSGNDRHYLRNTYVPAQEDCYLFKITLWFAGVGIQGGPLLHLDAAELTHLEPLINFGTDDEILRFREAQGVRENMTEAVAGA